METLARRRLTGVAGALLLIVSLVSIVALPALAHTASVSPSCNSLTVNLTYYNGRYDNSLVVTIDGVVVENLSDFGTGHSEVYPWSSSANHTYSVVVTAWDDPTGSKGWSKSWNGSWQACNPPTTTTTAPPTTTTTAAPTTTTTAAPTTTTTVQHDYYDGGADDYDHGSGRPRPRLRRRLLRRLLRRLRPRFSSRLLRRLRRRRPRPLLQPLQLLVRSLQRQVRSPQPRAGRRPRRLLHRRPRLLRPPLQRWVWAWPGSRCRPRLLHR